MYYRVRCAKETSSVGLSICSNYLGTFNILKRRVGGDVILKRFVKTVKRKRICNVKNLRNVFRHAKCGRVCKGYSIKRSGCLTTVPIFSGVPQCRSMRHGLGVGLFANICVPGGQFS